MTCISGVYDIIVTVILCLFVKLRRREARNGRQLLLQYGSSFLYQTTPTHAVTYIDIRMYSTCVCMRICKYV